MATHLTKPVKRLFYLRPDWQARGWFVITMTPEGNLVFKEKGKRTRIQIPLLTCYSTAMRLLFLANKREKELKNKNRKKIKR